MKKQAWTVGVALSLLVASAHVGLAQIIGDWAVDNMAMGAGQTLSFRPDGTYEYKISRIWPGTRQVIQAETGTYTLQRDSIALYGRNGRREHYRWRLGRDKYVGTPMLFLRDDQGVEQLFYASQQPDENCGEMFVNCHIAGKPYAYCQQQLAACKAR